MATIRAALGSVLLLALAGCCARRVSCEAGPVAGTTAAPRPWTRVEVVRHGEAFKNLPHAPDARPEDLDRLTPTGISQADAVVAQLRGLDVAAIVASPTARTRETASRIALALGSPVPAVSDALVSVREGRIPDGSMSTMAWRISRWDAGEDPRPQGGESLADATARAVRAVDALVAEHPGRVVVVVTHDDIAAALLGQAAGTPMPRRLRDHGIPAGSRAEVLVEGGRWRLATPPTTAPVR